MMLSSRPQSPRIPLCVLCTADGSSHQLSTVIDQLRLDSLLSAGLISDYRVYTLTPDVTIQSSLSIVRTAELLRSLYQGSSVSVLSINTLVAVWLNGNKLVLINNVTLCRGQLVLGWMIAYGLVNHLINQTARQLSQAIPPLLGTVSNNKSWGVRRHTIRCISPKYIHGLVV